LSFEILDALRNFAILDVLLLSRLYNMSACNHAPKEQGQDQTSQGEDVEIIPGSVDSWGKSLFENYK
jgi:hypothetical protein